MKNTTVYDKAKWHYDGEFPKDLSTDQAFVHTGMFLGWVIDNNLFDKDNFEKLGLADLVQKFKNKEVTGTEIYKALDGSFTNEDLDDIGNTFAQYYFDKDYLKDYEKTLGSNVESLYHVQDTWENYDRIKKVIDKRFDKFNGKKWWKFF